MSLLNTILEKDLFKARHGRYADTAENRRLHRVGQEYGHAAKEEISGSGRKPARQGDEQKNSLAVKLDSLSPTQLSKLVNTTDKKIQEFKDKGYSQGVQKLEEIAHEAKKRLMGDDAYEKKDLVQRVKDAVSNEKDAGKVEQDWEDKIRDYISKHYPTQANVTAETNSPKGREEREKMKNDPELKRMLEQSDREFREADEREQAERERGNEKPVDTVDKKLTEKPKADKKPKSASDDVKVEARMTFNDIPMSRKVNMTKYLSGKRKNKVDEDFVSIKNLDSDTIQTLHDGLVNKFNEEFDSMSKADRAEALYKIAKVKNELKKRSAEPASDKFDSGNKKGEGNDPVKLGKDLLGDIKDLYAQLKEGLDDESIDEDSYYDLEAQAEEWEDKFLSTVKLASKGKRVDSKILDRAAVRLQKLYDKVSDLF